MNRGELAQRLADRAHPPRARRAGSPFASAHVRLAGRHTPSYGPVRRNSVSTKAAPEISSHHPCRCCAPGRFSAPSLPDPRQTASPRGPVVTGRRLHSAHHRAAHIARSTNTTTARIVVSLARSTAARVARGDALGVESGRGRGRAVRVTARYAATRPEPPSGSHAHPCPDIAGELDGRPTSKYGARSGPPPRGGIGSAPRRTEGTLMSRLLCGSPPLAREEAALLLQV